MHSSAPHEATPSKLLAGALAGWLPEGGSSFAATLLHNCCLALQAVAAYGCLGTTVAIKTIEGNSSSEEARPALMAGLSDLEHADEVTGSIDSLWSAIGEARQKLLCHLPWLARLWWCWELLCLWHVQLWWRCFGLFIACSGCVWCETAASEW